jgi:transcriptional regulator with XRE-family HTH domain
VREPDISGIGTRVRAARRRRGWNREALAFHSGISAAAVAQIESGRRTNLRPATVSAIAGALGLTVDYVIDGGSPRPPMFEHLAYVYDSDDSFVETVGAILEEGAEAGDGLLIVASTAKIDLLRERLGRAAEPVEFTESASWLTSPAGAIDGFRNFANRKLALGANWVRVVGEPIWELSDQAEVDRWKRFESLLNLVFAGWPLTMLCPYDRRTVDPEIIGCARRTHPRMFEEPGPSLSASYADPGGFVLGD